MVKRLRIIDSQDSTREKLSDRGAAAAAKRKKILVDSEDESEAATCVPSVAKELPPIPTSDLGPERRVLRKKRQSNVTTAQDRAAAPERPRRACVAANSSNARANVELRPPPSAVDQSDSNKVEAENELTGGKFRSYLSLS
jgi:hypothetical protein